MASIRPCEFDLRRLCGYSNISARQRKRGALTMAYFDSNGVQIHFEEQGSGDAVVLVHGFASRAEHNWAGDWIPTLAQHYRVVTLDCRGHDRAGPGGRLVRDRARGGVSYRGEHTLTLPQVRASCSSCSRR